MEKELSAEALRAGKDKNKQPDTLEFVYHPKLKITNIF